MEVFQVDDAEPEDDIAPPETLDQGRQPAPTAEFEEDADIAVVSPEISLMTEGSADSPGRETPTPTQKLAESIPGEMIAEPVTATAEPSVDIPDAPEIDPSTNQVAQPQLNALDSVLAELGSHGLDSRLRISQVAESVHLEVNDKILFARGSTQLKPEGENLLQELAQVLLQYRGVISVEGHTDNRPISSRQFPSNWELSSGRATTVTRHLINHGLDPKRLRAVGYADTRPLEENTSREGRMRNRRVSLIMAPAPVPENTSALPKGP